MELEVAERNMSTIQEQELEIRRQKAAVSAFFEKYSLNLTYVGDFALLEEEMNQDRDRLVDLERGVGCARVFPVCFASFSART